MAHFEGIDTFPAKAASAIAQWVPVRFLGLTGIDAGSALDHTVIRAGSLNEDAVGFTLATVASPGDPVAIAFRNIVKGIAGASIGAGARLAVGSTNGVLIQITPSAAAAPIAFRYTVGRAVENAAAGDVFSLFVQVDQLI